MKTASIILAAGQGTRMRSRLPKVLHPILSKPMVLYALEAARAVSDYAPVLVVGHAAEVVRSAVEAADGSALFALQEQQLGTGVVSTGNQSARNAYRRLLYHSVNN